MKILFSTFAILYDFVCLSNNFPSMLQAVLYDIDYFLGIKDIVKSNLQRHPDISFILEIVI
jgi:hypothetical protein